ncbi:MAG: hypothetical protein OXI74_02810 [Rhodospirillaceae bacterium]|nr:hypothetical protein [Rhodospirillaceae bacterium]
MSGESGRAIAARLRSLSAERKNADWSELPREAADLIRKDPFALLTAVCFDRGMPWVRAWSIPYEIARRGFLRAELLAEMSEPEVESLLDDLPVRPRYGTRRGAETISDAARLVRDQYDGDAGNIWRDAAPAEVETTLLRIRGVGKGIAAMTTRILYDDFDCFRGKERQIDIKPDSHLLRVFQRTGLIARQSAQEAISAARRLSPDFPGAIDWSAWTVGRRWCHQTSPECDACYLAAECPRQI